MTEERDSPPPSEPETPASDDTPEAVAPAEPEAPKPAAHAGALEKARASWGFPSFARDFPDHPELARLVEAFGAGDYATVRSGAPALAAKTDDANVKHAAELLRARIEPDPTARLFFALTAALLVFLMTWWATHDGPQHHAPAPAKVAPTVEFVK